MEISSFLERMRIVILSLSILAVNLLSAQIGGRGAYGFLAMQPSPRLASLGGAPVAIHDNDPNIGFQLPAMLHRDMNLHLGINYINYFSDINSGQLAYVRGIDSHSAFSAGLFYTNYGKFIRTDAGGNEEGRFTGGDYSLQAGYGRRSGKWSYGANVKFIFSQLESYVSTGAAVDLNAGYTADSGLLAMSLLVRNAGIQFSTYAGTRERLPFEIQWSFSRKLKHAPLRLIAVVHNLQTWDISYINTNERNRNISFDDPNAQQKVSFGDKVFRHVILATELVFSKNFMVRVGYNHQRRQEMTWDNGKKLTGFAWGVGIKISKFRFDYANAAFFPGKSSHQFALTLNLNEFKKSK